MGRLANTLDWTEERGSHSGIRTVPLAPAESDAFPRISDADEALSEEPTLRLTRPVPKGPNRDLERAITRDLARLDAALEWIMGEDPWSPVVAFVRALLADFEGLIAAADTLASEALGGRDAAALTAPRDAFVTAVATWRLRVVGYIDDLALAEPRSLDAWTSLPEYAATCFSSSVGAPLAALEQCAAAAQGSAIAVSVAAITTCIARLERTLHGIADRSEATTLPIARPLRSTAW